MSCLLYQFLCGTVEGDLSQSGDFFFQGVNGWPWPVCSGNNSAQ